MLSGNELCNTNVPSLTIGPDTGQSEQFRFKQYVFFFAKEVTILGKQHIYVEYSLGMLLSKK